MGISTHVLDTAAGRPAVDVGVLLERSTGSGWAHVAEGATDSDGRVGGLVSDSDLAEGIYRITFASGAYFAARGERTFYPRASIEFEVHDASEHYHVPLLVSAFGYSTYRGS